jgi:hypothetical protein
MGGDPGVVCVALQNIDFLDTGNQPREFLRIGERFEDLFGASGNNL